MNPFPPRRGLPWPRRRTARLRLTILSGALFLLTGAALLAITYLLFEQGTGQKSAGGRGSGLGGGFGGIPASAGGPLPTNSSGGQNGNQALAAARRAAEAAQIAKDRHVLLIDVGVALAVAAALALLIGWFFAGRTLRPLRTITAAARRISASNLNQRLALNDADEEFKELGDTLDDLFARLEAAFKAQEHFVANASHELRTPLTAERTLLQIALDDPHTTNATWRTTATEVLASNKEQEQLIEALLALASSESGLDHPERLDLAAVCDEVLKQRKPHLDNLDLRLETAIQAAPLDGDPRLLERLAANLVENAITHNVAGGHIHLATTLIDGKPVLTVSNTGPNIPSADVDRLFQPFQRLDPGRTHHKDSHGLGLSIVRAIATAHHATITAEPLTEGGLSVTVRFPPTKPTIETNMTPETRHPGARDIASPSGSPRSCS